MCDEGNACVERGEVEGSKRIQGGVVVLCNRIVFVGYRFLFRFLVIFVFLNYICSSERFSDMGILFGISCISLKVLSCRVLYIAVIWVQ